MISYRDALKRIQEIAQSHSKKEFNSQVCELSQAIGFILAEDILSRENLPAFNNSAMDGYALCSDLTKNASDKNSIKFEILNEIAAGVSVDSKNMLPTGCVRILTGAKVPDCFDCVVKQEDVEVHEKHILLKNPVNIRENIRLIGEDIKKHEMVAARGTVITSEVVLLLASLGVTHLKVLKPLKLYLLSTGKELVDYNTDKKLSETQIRNSTAVFLSSFSKWPHINVKWLGICQDDPQDFKSRIQEALRDKPDVILTTGAVSVGTYDFIADSLKELGAKIYFHKVAIRPGKPVLFAEIKGSESQVLTAFWGLPGNPVSTAVGWRFFVNPYLKWLLNPSWNAEASLDTRVLSNSFKKPDGLQCFFKARKLAGNKIEILTGQASFMVKPLIHSDCWAILEPEGGFVQSGASINCLALEEEWR